jgi:hypothetical protein
MNLAAVTIAPNDVLFSYRWAAKTMLRLISDVSDPKEHSRAEADSADVG